MPGAEGGLQNRLGLGPNSQGAHLLVRERSTK